MRAAKAKKAVAKELSPKPDQANMKKRKQIVKQTQKTKVKKERKAKEPNTPKELPSGVPSSIKYFVHALNSDALASGAVPIVQPVNSASYGSFGQATVFAYTIREGSDLSSKTLGTIRGLEVYNSMIKNETTILLLNTVVYNDGVYNGTISLHGQADTSETDYELTVVGGTGFFRGVAGYAAIHNLHTSGDDHVFQHTLHFLSGPSVNVE